MRQLSKQCSMLLHREERRAFHHATRDLLAIDLSEFACMMHRSCTYPHSLHAA